MRRLVDYIASLATEDRRAIVAQELAKFDKGFLGPDIELHSKLVRNTHMLLISLKGRLLMRLFAIGGIAVGEKW